MSLPALVDSTEVYCSEGRQGLVVCHGTALVHPTGRSECLDDPECRLIREVHAFVVSCDEIGCQCC